MNIKELSYEEAFSKLEEILEKVEEGDLKLNESLEVFKIADQLYSHCSDLLNKAEGEIKIIIDGKEEDFKIPMEV